MNSNSWGRDASQESNSSANPSETLSTVKSVKAKVWLILQNGLSNIMSDANRAFNGPDATDYESERNMITQLILKPISYGAIASSFCFLSFRVGSSPKFLQFRSRIVGKSVMKKPPMEQDANPMEWKSYTERLAEKKGKAFNESLSSLTDLGLSLMLGLSITALNVNTSVLKQSLEVAPLLPGRSLMSEHLCTDMAQLYSRVDPAIWETQDDKTIDALRSLVENCTKREERELEIRQEQNLPDGYKVSIPYPGVLPSK